MVAGELVGLVLSCVSRNGSYDLFHQVLIVGFPRWRKSATYTMPDRTRMVPIEDAREACAWYNDTDATYVVFF